MSLNFNRPVRPAGTFVGFALAITFLLSSTFLLAQTTISTGSIQGTVTDPSGAVVSGAKVTITERSQGSVATLSTNSAGAYNSGALVPGNYVVRVEASGFKASQMPVTVQVDNTASANIKLQVGQMSETVEVEAESVQVNTEQATVQGVLTANQIENLPVNGRNFLDLAQLEPGVQIQDGTNFDPTKVGYSSISFGGRFGRTARIEVDGVDVSDETVGTTTEDIPASAIQEFSIAQSSLDLSNDLTSSGAVNVVTKSGTNQFHGEAFTLFRDSSVAAALPTAPGLTAPFQRTQDGGRIGGPILKDKLFFFIDGEYTLQHLQSPVSLGAPFTAYSGDWPAPFKDEELMGRLDYQIGKSARAFYRFTYFHNSDDATFFPSSFQVYNNVDYTRNQVAGVDFNTGTFTHAIRFSYLKFQNQIVDGTIGTGLPFANYPVSIAIGQLATGPNYLAPQSTPQSDHQLKYDGSKAIGNHILRYGASWNHIQGGGFAGFFSIQPYAIGIPGYLAPVCFTAAGTPNLTACPNGPDGTQFSNPLNYAMYEALISNGQGYSTENPALGFPAGGLGPDNRLGFYIGDSWKILRNLTISPGLRYVRDTGRTDSDLPAIPQLNAAFPGWGNAVKQPNLNFAPQLGIAWDPSGNGKTSIRAGIGLFYENVIYNNVLFDRPLRLQKGAFLYYTTPCLNGSAQSVSIPGGTLPFDGASVCGTSGSPLSIGQSAAALAAVENSLKANYPFDPNLPNGAFVGNQIAEGANVGTGLFDPNYKTPRSLQMNIGIQHEIKRGLVFSADYLRNVETKTLLSVDVNDTGNVKYFNAKNAASAIASTLAACGATSINQAIAACPGLEGTGGATISDFASFGLATSGDVGASCLTAGLGYGCAFGGANPAAGAMPFLEPVGRSVYNAFQTKLVWNTQRPFEGVKAVNFQVAYSLSRFDNPAAYQGTTPPQQPGGVNDQDFVINAADNDNPERYMGPSLLDRTHQISFGGNFDVPYGFRFGIIAHFYSPLSSPVIVGNTGSGGQIFQTDFTGSGVTSDPMPGTTNGAFGRQFGVSGLNGAIAQYNQNVAGTATPAGQALINAGLMTLTQLQQLGAVAPTLSPAPTNQLPFTWMKDADLKLSWLHTFHDRFTIEPSVGFFNVFNFANYSLPPGIMTGWLNAGAGSINSTPQSVPVGGSAVASNAYRVGLGTGVFGLGSPRVLEFGLRFSF